MIGLIILILLILCCICCCCGGGLYTYYTKFYIPTFKRIFGLDKKK